MTEKVKLKTAQQINNIREKRAGKLYEFCKFLCCLMDYWSLPSKSVSTGTFPWGTPLDRYSYTDLRLGYMAPKRWPEKQHVACSIYFCSWFQRVQSIVAMVEFTVPWDCGSERMLVSVSGGQEIEGSWNLGQGITEGHLSVTHWVKWPTWPPPIGPQCPEQCHTLWTKFLDAWAFGGWISHLTYTQ